MKRLIGVLAACTLATFGCGEGIPTDINLDPRGNTTPSNIPAGNLPPIPVPKNVGDITTAVSDSVNTTMAPLAGDFLPWVTDLTGAWNLDRRAMWPDRLLGELYSCRYSVIEIPNSRNSAAIDFPRNSEDCSNLQFPWRYVVYPAQRGWVSLWLNRQGTRTAYRPHLIQNGMLKTPDLWQVRLSESHAGDQTLVNGPLRAGCELGGTLSASAQCPWIEEVLGTVRPRLLTNPVYLRRDVYWEKAGNSAVFSNTANTQITQSFTRTWTAGTSETESESFARIVGAELGAGLPVSAETANAKVSASLTRTFERAITVSTSTSREETYSVTIAAKTTAVFEVWNLVEQYTFTNAAGEPYEDPSYTFKLAGLTSRATIATAFVSTPFPN